MLLGEDVCNLLRGVSPPMSGGGATFHYFEHVSLRFQLWARSQRRIVVVELRAGAVAGVAASPSGAVYETTPPHTESVSADGLKQVRLNSDKGGVLTFSTKLHTPIGEEQSLPLRYPALPGHQVVVVEQTDSAGEF